MSPAVSRPVFGAKLPFALRISSGFHGSATSRVRRGVTISANHAGLVSDGVAFSRRGYRECALLQISERKFEESIGIMDGTWLERAFACNRRQSR